jgi:hypothetical protein
MLTTLRKQRHKTKSTGFANSLTNPLDNVSKERCATTLSHRYRKDFLEIMKETVNQTRRM